MAVKIEYLRDGRVTVSHYEKNLTVDDVEWAIKHLMERLSKASVRLHSIADFSEVRTLPPRLLSLARKHQREIHHPMMGKYIVITHSTFLKTMLNTILRILPSINLIVVNTMDEALAEVDKLLAAEVQTKTA